MLFYTDAMDSQLLESLLAWVGHHPVAAGAVIFLVAFCDAVVILGFFVPAIPILFAIGALIGLGTLDGPYAIACAALGAFLGDGLSYVLGRVHGDRLRRIWPFSRHPEWLPQGEAMLRRHGLKSILIARYVGAVRPLVPAIAGMLDMPAKRYVPASAAAGLSWAAVFLIPGWVFGASLDLFAAVAGRLAIVLAALAAILALIGFTVYQAYRFFTPRTSVLLARLLRWSVRHPVLGRFTQGLIDPRRRESPSLMAMAFLLVLAGWAFFSVLMLAAGNDEPTTIDLDVHHLMFGLRTPLADHLMAVLSSFGDWQVLLAGMTPALAWLALRKRWSAVLHWIAGFGFGMALIWALDALVQVPRPPTAMAVAGFDFPSAPVTMATIVYGFFAVLIARELPRRGRGRAWPYAVAALLVTSVAFARLYLGAHWLTDVLGGICLGVTWISILGLAYRRRAPRSFWMRPLALLFYLGVASFGLWHANHHASATLAQFAPPQIRLSIPATQWQTHDWANLPARRNDFLSTRAWPLNVQYAGTLSSLRDRLLTQGWQPGPDASLEILLASLDKNASAESLPVLPASHNGHGDALLLWHAGPRPNTRWVLHLWFAPIALEPDATPVWQGTAVLLQFDQALSLFHFWRVQQDDHTALDALRSTLSDFAPARRSREQHLGDVLLLREQ
ncbi:MAG TPA: VTT domain-containing protein [Chiayiivirga sp.]|nr:VTT domain-containing protein [Chiayiivirga sp.]